jgi:hypothetical protein
MLPFVPDVIRPLLEALDPQAIVEIGSEHGKTTRHLVEHAKARGAIVHAIDPAPLFDADAWEAELSPTLVVHRKTSLAALPTVPRFDAVLIDGDHNWYTVFHELTLIEKLARERGHGLPLVLLHDVAWPYGRRDLYYDVDSIPEEHRQPCAKGGISPTASELLPRGGFNAHLMHAVLEGGRRNGVLTAVEDWVEASSSDVELVVIPAVFGLAIAIPAELSARVPALSKIAAAWAVPEVSRFIGRLEMARIAMLTR